MFRWFYIVLIPNFFASPHSQQSHPYVLTSNWSLPSLPGGGRLPSSSILVRSKPVMRWWSHGGGLDEEEDIKDVNGSQSVQPIKTPPQFFFKEMISFLGALTGSNRTQWLFVGRKLCQSNPSVFPPVGNRQTLICAIMHTDFCLHICLEICPTCVFMFIMI